MLRLHHGWKGAESMSANPLEAPLAAPVVTPVNISVTPGSTDPNYQFTIDYWPKRRSDVRVFFTQTGPGNPAKPREVEWIATGLTGTQQIVIDAKVGVQTNHLGNPANGGKPAEPPYILTVANSSRTSGPADHLPPPIGDLWQYSIRLVDGGKDVAKMIDPMVVIDHDP